MILALDVHYKKNTAKIVGLLFNWEDLEPKEVIVDYINEVKDYISGEFYKRELPCLMRIIEKIDLKSIEIVVIDGYIYINDNYALGLGGKLYEELDKKIPVIGVAKTPFFKNKKTVEEIKRGKSKNSLYISSIGFNLEEASKKIKNMAGEFRIPNILKKLDVLTKTD